MHPAADDSALFHYPNSWVTEYQARAMQIPVLGFQVAGKSKEDEAKALEEVIVQAKALYNIDGVVFGGISSVFQKNAFEGIRRTLTSIVEQDAPARVVVVAAGDLTAVRASSEELGAEVVEQQSRGLSAAINEGWEHAGADLPWWTWLGDDDELLPGSLARTGDELARHPAASMVYGRCRYVDAAGRTLWTARPGRLAGPLARFGPNLVPQPGSLLRAAAVRDVGLLDPSLRYAMDIDLFLRLQTVGPLRYVPQELAAFRWHATSTTVANQGASDAELAAVRHRHLGPAGRRLLPVLGPVASLVGRTAYRLDRVRALSRSARP
jgi:GT2 family glycosyltransferase